MDLLIELAVTCGPIVLAAMGLFVSVKPLQPKRWVHWTWFGAFAIIGMLTAIAGFLELKSTNAAQVRLVAKQDDMNNEIGDLKSSIDRLATGVHHIGQVSGYPIITEEQAEALVKTLIPFVSNEITIKILCAVNVGNACTFAGQWNAILTKAGWGVLPLTQALFVGPVSGVSLTVMD